MSLTHRGVNLISVGPTSPSGLKLQLVQGFGGGLSVRGRDIIVPGLEGRIWMPRKADVRSLLIEGWVIGEEPEDWRFYTDVFHSIFDPSLAPGEIAVTGPYLGVEAGVTYTIDARTLNAMPGPILGGTRFQRWSVELESVDPDWASSGGSGS